MTCLEHSQSEEWDLGSDVEGLAGTGEIKKNKPLPALRPAGVLALDSGSRGCTCISSGRRTLDDGQRAGTSIVSVVAAKHLFGQTE